MNAYNRQQGIALMVSLVLLLLLTIIAITAASVSTLQVRMASNSQQQNVAFQATESGLQAWIEQWQDNPPATETDTTLTLADDLNGTSARVRVQSPTPPLCTDIPQSLTSPVIYVCYEITSHGKACDNAACDPTTSDGNARARHLLGYKAKKLSGAE